MARTMNMPALSAGLEEVVIARWLKGAGEAVKAGEALAEVETDKATMEIEAEVDGVIAALLVETGATVAVGAPFIRFDGEGADAPESAAPIVVPPPAKRPEPVVTVARRDGIKVSPLARRLAATENLPLEGLTGTGFGHRIVKKDIERAVAKRAVAPLPPASAPAAPAPIRFPAAKGRHVPLATMRKVIAARLTEAKATIPHFYLDMSCEIDALLDLRRRLNDAADGAAKLSVNDFIVKAVALALRKVPEINAAWAGDSIFLFDDVDVSVAVATEDGLFTPVLRQADRKGLAALSADMKALAEKARENRLKPEEYHGGGFTISNLGMFGIENFSAIINPPQCAILAVGAGQRQPVARGDALEIATVMKCRLSVDHRVADGAAGARFLAALKAMIEQPLNLML